MKPASTKKLSLALLTLALIGGGVFWFVQTAQGVNRTWDGGGVDGTCGGAGTANNWSCAANWSGDVAPGVSDIAIFDGTSTKNATIDANISVAGISINAGYTGTITQSSTFTVTVGASNFVQADGTFTGGSGAISINNGNFTLSGGVFTSTSGTLSLGKSTGAIFTHTAGGTFNHNNGTVFGTTWGLPGTTFDVATTETFYDFTVTASDLYSSAIASGDTIVVLGTFTHTDGVINGGTIEPRGNVVIGSTADPGGTTVLSFLVAGDQTITGNGGNTGVLSINKASGTLSAGSTNLGVHSFILAGGTFMSTSGTLRVAGKSNEGGVFTHTAGGTFDHNNGTVNMASNGNVNIIIDVATSETFNNFIVSMQHTWYTTISSGDTIIVLGTFTHTDGEIRTGTIEARGDVIIGVGADAGTTTLSFTGGNTQTYTDQGGNEVNGDVTINKSAGTVTLASNADWNATSQDVTITSGELSSATYNITTTNFTVNGGVFTGGSGTVTTSGPMLVSSGTFTGGSGATTINNSFTLSGGTFTSTSGALTVTTEFTHTAGGTFHHNNGHVLLGVSNTGARTIDVTSTETFYDLTINSVGVSSSRTIASGDTLIVLGTFTHTDGPIDTGTIEARGNVVLGSLAGNGSSTITFLVAGDQTITGNSGGTCNININKPSGTVSAGTTNLYVTGFTLSSGTFISTSGSLTVATEFTHTAGGTFHHNNGHVLLGVSNTGARTIDVTSTETFYDLTINSVGVSSSRTIASGDTLIVLGTFTHTDGPIDTGTIEARGNVVVGGAAAGGTATLSFTGGNTQTYTDQGGNEVYGDITINKTANSVTLASNADWNAASQDLIITAGTLLQTSTYAVATGAVTIGGSGQWVNNGTGAVTLGGAVSNAGLIDFRTNNTCGGTDSIVLQSSVNGTQRAWSGAGTFVMRDIAVKDMGGSAAITAYSSTNTSGNGGNWTFNAACPFPIQPKAGISTGKMNLQSGKMNLR